MSPSATPDRPHRGHQRDARRLAKQAGITYQQALKTVMSSAGAVSVGPLLAHVRFGIPEIDAVTGRLPDAGTVLVRGKAGSGTSALLMQTAVGNAARGCRVLYVALETSRECAVERLTALSASSWGGPAPGVSLRELLRERGCEPDDGRINCPLPDHEDRHPSASYTPAQDGNPESWRCQRCAVGGTAVDLLVHADGLSATAAVAELSRRAADARLPASLNVISPASRWTSADLDLILDQLDGVGERPQLVCVDPLTLLEPVTAPVAYSDRPALAAQDLRALAERRSVIIACSAQLSKMAQPGVAPPLIDTSLYGTLPDLFDYTVCVWRPAQREGLTKDERHLHRDEWFCALEQSEHAAVPAGPAVALNAPWTRPPSTGPVWLPTSDSVDRGAEHPDLLKSADEQADHDEQLAAGEYNLAASRVLDAHHHAQDEDPDEPTGTCGICGYADGWRTDHAAFGHYTLATVAEARAWVSADPRPHSE